MSDLTISIKAHLLDSAVLGGKFGAYAAFSVMNGPVGPVGAREWRVPGRATSTDAWPGRSRSDGGRHCSERSAILKLSPPRD